MKAGIIFEYYREVVHNTMFVKVSYELKVFGVFPEKYLDNLSADRHSTIHAGHTLHVSDFMIDEMYTDASLSPVIFFVSVEHMFYCKNIVKDLGLIQCYGCTSGNFEFRLADVEEKLD